VQYTIFPTAISRRKPLLNSIHSFFESRSAYEITVSFLQRFFHLILEKRLGAGSKDAARHVEEVLQYRGAQTHWVNVMRKKRNLLIHSRDYVARFRGTPT